MGRITTTLAALALVGTSAAQAASLPVVLQYEVFASATSEAPVGTIITLSLDFAGGLPAETSPPYDSRAPGEDQLAAGQNSRFDDLATATITFSNSARVITGSLGEVLVVNGNASVGDQFRVSYTDNGEDGLSGDLDFFVDSQGIERTADRVTVEFRGPNTLITSNEQFIGTALDDILADPFAWDRLVGGAVPNQAPRRLQIALGDAPGFPEINATLVPVPAALWMFGSALGMLGWVRSKARS